MKTVTPTELRNNIYKILDDILQNGMPVEIIRKGRHLRIEPVEKSDKLKKLVKRPETVAGNPEDLVSISWEKEMNLDLP